MASSVPITSKSGNGGSNGEVGSRPSLPWESFEAVVVPHVFQGPADFLIKSINRRLVVMYDDALNKMVETSIEEDLDVSFVHAIPSKAASKHLEKAYETIAQHSMVPMLDALLSWSKSQHNKKTEWNLIIKAMTSKPASASSQGGGALSSSSSAGTPVSLAIQHQKAKDYEPVLNERKSLTTDYMLCRLVLIVLRSWSPENDVTQAIAEALTVAALLHFKKSAAAHKSEVVNRNRKLVSDMYAEALGVISPPRYHPLADRFFQEIDTSFKAKNVAEVTALIQGMRYLRLQIGDNDAKEKSLKVVSKVMEFVDQKFAKKLELKVALFDLLASLLTPMLELSEAPRIDYKAWHALLADLFGKAEYFGKKQKVQLTTFPLQAAILCVSPLDYFKKHSTSFLDALIKCMKPGDKLRAVALECTYRMLLTHFTKFQPLGLDVTPVLGKVANDVFPLHKKPISTLYDDCIDIYVDIANLVSITKPEYATQTIVSNMLKEGSSVMPERYTIGLRAAFAIHHRLLAEKDAAEKLQLEEETSPDHQDELVSPRGHSPLRMRVCGGGGGAVQGTPGTITPRQVQNKGGTLGRWYRKSSLRVLAGDNARQANEAEVAAAFRTQVSNALDRLLKTLDAQIGNLLGTTQYKPLAELVPKEKVVYLNVMHATLACTRIGLPSNMPKAEFFSLLCRLTIHLHEGIRTEAWDLLLFHLSQNPIYGPTILDCFARFVFTVPDSYVVVLKSSLERLTNLMTSWYEVVRYRPALRESNVDDIISSLPANHLEGMGLVYLGSANVDVRVLAMKVIQLTRQLNTVVPAWMFAVGTRLADHIDANAAMFVCMRRRDPMKMRKCPLVKDDDGEFMLVAASEDEDDDDDLFDKDDDATESTAAGGDLNDGSEVDSLNEDDGSGSGSDGGDGTDDDADVTLDAVLSGFGGGGGGDGDAIQSMVAVVEAASSKVDKKAGDKKTADKKMAHTQEIPSTARPGHASTDAGHEDILPDPLRFTPQTQWARVYGQMVASSAAECSESVHCAFEQARERFELVNVVVSKEKTLEMDSNLAVLWRNYMILVCAASGAFVDTDKDSIVASLKLILPSLKADTHQQRSAAQLALWYCQTPVYEVLLERVAAFEGEKIGGLGDKDKKRLKKNLLHGEAAAVVRSCASTLDEAVFVSDDDLLKSFVLYVRGAMKFIQLSSSDPSSTYQVMRHDFFVVVADLADQIHWHIASQEDEFWPRDLRKSLFTLASKFCGNGADAQAHNESFRKHFEAVTEKVKATDDRKRLASVLTYREKCLNFAATRAMAGVVMGNAWEEKVFFRDGEVIKWLASSFSSGSNDIHSACRLGAKSFIQANLEKVEFHKFLHDFIDRSYTSEGRTGRGFFLLVTDIITSRLDVKYQLVELINLVLFKLAEDDAVVRKHAVSLLNFLCNQYFGDTGGDIYHLSANTSVYSTYSKQVLAFSKALSVDHPELSLLLLDEIMKRIPTVRNQTRMLEYLSPWINNIHFSKLKRDRVESILRSLFVVTLKHGRDTQHKELIQKLWVNLASDPKNVVPTIDFLLALLANTQNTFVLQEYKKICVYISRSSSRETIAKLVSELHNTEVMITASAASSASPSSSSSSSTSSKDGKVKASLSKASGSSAAKRSSGANRGSSSSGDSAGSGPPASLSKASGDKALSAMAADAGDVGGDGLPSDPCPGDLSSWVVEDLVPRVRPNRRPPLSRAHFALLTLVELAIEDVVECQRHLPILLHSCILGADDPNPMIRAHVKNLLENVIFNLVAHNVDENSPEHSEWKKLEAHLSVTRKQPFWGREDITSDHLVLTSAVKLDSIVRRVVACLAFQSDLLEEWGAEALRVAVSSPRYHYIARSLQVYRSLRPNVTAQSLADLAQRLYSHIATRSDGNVSLVLEVIYTLKTVYQHTATKEDFIALPQLFWLAISLLNSDNEVEYGEAVELVRVLYSRLEATSSVHKALVSVIPRTWSPAFQGVQVYTFKGLTNPGTSEASRKLLARFLLSGTTNGSIIDLDPSRRLIGNTIALVPHLVMLMGKEDTTEISKSFARRYAEGEHAAIADVFRSYPEKYSHPEVFVARLASSLATAFFPNYVLFTFSFLSELLASGYFPRPILRLLFHLLKHVDLTGDSDLAKRGIALFAPVTALVDNVEVWQDAVDVINVVLSRGGTIASIDISHAKRIDILNKMTAFDVRSNTWTEGPKGRHAMCVALRQILDSFGHSIRPYRLPDVPASGLRGSQRPVMARLPSVRLSARLPKPDGVATPPPPSSLPGGSPSHRLPINLPPPPNFPPPPSNMAPPPSSSSGDGSDSDYMSSSDTESDNFVVPKPSTRKSSGRSGNSSNKRNK
eukprot:TRINITY_DN1445_c0_g1_i1.p1 TRINITY_DN1445_c0_g1~~TRINITY_DN1445_c0_g1_i1.p1  ORF type:complete len:2342 (+),score=793.62 TRINITY_DN1445_c0_g1_i1:378-7403(+)